NEPRPLPRRTTAALLDWLAVTASSLSSPLKSARATPRGPDPIANAVGAVNEGATRPTDGGGGGGGAATGAAPSRTFSALAGGREDWPRAKRRHRGVPRGEGRGPSPPKGGQSCTGPVDRSHLDLEACSRPPPGRTSGRDAPQGLPRAPAETSTGAPGCSVRSRSAR